MSAFLDVTGPDFAPNVPAAAYADPAARVEQWRSENTGDIVLLANMIEGQFYFDSNVQTSDHGSLKFADAVIPLAFAYRRATDQDSNADTVLDPVIKYLQTLADKARISAAALAGRRTPSRD